MGIRGKGNDMESNAVLPGIWLGHYCLATLAAMIADMCESVECTRNENSAWEVMEGVVAIAEYVADSAEGVNLTLGQIAAIVGYCERSYGEEATVEALADAGANPDIIAEAQAMKAKA